MGADDLATHGCRCQWCRSPVAVLVRADTDELVHLDPQPMLGAPWQVNADRTRCRRAPRPGPVRYAAHADTCAARNRDPAQGLCRGRPDCRSVVTLYGDDAALLCAECATVLAQWRRSPAARRGPWPLC